LLSFFFQAEAGIRAFHVTGVQTCALPISGVPQRLSLALLPCLLALPSSALAQATLDVRPLYPTAGAAGVPTSASLRIEFRGALRSEERRGGNAGRGGQPAERGESHM